MKDKSTGSDTVVITRPKLRDKTATRRIPPYHVILENDDVHSFEFVVGVLQKTFGYDPQKAFLLTHEAHSKGRAVVWTGAKEVAELKVDQLRTFHEVRSDGAQFGPLSCTIEPAPGA
jgi:ATP-dependent Clp protease adaptor protein ClpS